MPRQREMYPSYRHHKKSGQAVVTLTDPSGARRDVLLGPHDTPESRAEHDRVVAEWIAAGRRLSAPATAGSTAVGSSVAEVVLAFWQHAEKHYRHADGEPTSELRDYRNTLRPLVHLYGKTPAASFGPLALKAVRDVMVRGYDHPEHGSQEALARNTVNQRVGRIKRVFKWAVENELVPPSVFHGLQAVVGLKKGRSDARETEPVLPVPLDVVEATLPHATRPVAAMIRVQLLTGCRPGEGVVMRPCDLDRTGDVWLYRPGSDVAPEGKHKTAHHGKGRVIAIGPKAQEVLKPFLEREPGAYLFSPKEAMEETRAALRKEDGKRRRKKRKAKPKRLPKDRYSVWSYDRAIARACRKADAAARMKAEQAGKSVEDGTVFVPVWQPNQLRHARGTEVRKRYGLEAAQVVLGHSQANVTQVYAERDQSLAAKVAAEMG